MTIRRILVAFLAILLVLGAVVGEGEAKKKRKKKMYRPNMPPGWVWPPSKQMKQDGENCLKDLDALGVVWKKGKATRKIATPVVIPSMELGGVKLVSVWRKPPFVMDCHLALAIAAYAGPELRKIGVSEIHFSSLHNYRNVQGTRILSRHALGLAMDVRRFKTDDGVVHVVEDDYPKGDATLLGVEDSIARTGAFRTVLTPGNDPKRHADHYHIEARTPRDKVVTKPRPDVNARAAPRN